MRCPLCGRKQSNTLRQDYDPPAAVLAEIPCPKHDGLKDPETDYFDKDGNYIHGTGFAKWPKGEPAGARASARDYAAHWSRCGAAFHRKRPQVPVSGAGYYGTPEGMTKSQVDAVLRATFVGVPTMIWPDEVPEQAAPSLTIVPKPKSKLAVMADKYRKAA